MAAHDHAHSPGGDRRWLAAALTVIVVFMVGEVIAGLLAHSLALVTDAAHMLTDAGALAVAIIASRIAQRPARGAYTYGFARVDALSGQASGITLILLAVWFAVEAVRRLVTPAGVHGGVVTVVALIGVAVNLVATAFAARADRSSLNVRGVLAHLVTDLWAFGATFVAGVVVLTAGWTRADALASLTVAALMAWTGWRLVRAAGRVFLEAAPTGVDPAVARDRSSPTPTGSRPCTTCTSGRSGPGRSRCRRTCWSGRRTTATRWPARCAPRCATGTASAT